MVCHDQSFTDEELLCPSLRSRISHDIHLSYLLADTFDSRLDRSLARRDLDSIVRFFHDFDGGICASIGRRRPQTPGPAPRQ